MTPRLSLFLWQIQFPSSSPLEPLGGTKKPGEKDRYGEWRERKNMEHCSGEEGEGEVVIIFVDL